MDYLQVCGLWNKHMHRYHLVYLINMEIFVSSYA